MHLPLHTKISYKTGLKTKLLYKLMWYYTSCPIFNSFFTYKNDVEVREPEFCTYIITKLTYITKVNRRQHGKSSTLAKSKIRLNIHHQLCLFCSWLHNDGFPISEKQKQRKSLQSGHPGFTTLHCLILCIISGLATSLPYTKACRNT